MIPMSSQLPATDDTNLSEIQALTAQSSSTCAAAEALYRAFPVLLETLSRHWSTGQGTRARHIVWSLYTCSHLVNLGDVCSGLDSHLADALAATITARLILGPEVEPVLRQLLHESGEFARFDKVADVTPDNLPVIYPPAPTDSRSLRRLAEAVDIRSRREKEPSGSR
jgi:hypothetical protein